MDTTAIKALIDKYQLVQVDDKLRTYAKGIDQATFVAEVGPHKAEIIRYFELKRQAAKAKADTEKAIFETIPGVTELREARTKAAKWTAALNRMMETGSGRMEDGVEQFAPQQLADLEAKYPMAVFALEAKRRAETTENYRLHAIWESTYKALCAGKAPEKVKADHNVRMNEFTKSVMFD